MKRRDFIRKTTGIMAGRILYGGYSLKSAVVAESGPLLKSVLKKNKMKITVLTGSPRRNGNTAYLAERFIEGAGENGHEVFRFDCAHHNIAGCMACNHCGMDGNCILKDDFEALRPHLTGADMIAFVTPMYYFGFSAQLKNVIDRFYAINGRLKGSPKKTALLMAYADTAESEAQSLLSHYRTLAGYLGWQDMGTVVAPGVWTAGAVRTTPYGEEAYRLGKSV